MGVSSSFVKVYKKKKKKKKKVPSGAGRKRPRVVRKPTSGADAVRNGGFGGPRKKKVTVLFLKYVFAYVLFDFIYELIFVEGRGRVGRTGFGGP